MASEWICPLEPSDPEIVLERSRPPPPPCARGQPDVPVALTDEQRRFAAGHHDLIYTFLHQNGWAVSEYYDIAALGFLSAVRRYLTETYLQQYAFSTVAWKSMKSSIASFHRSENRRRESERRYLETLPRQQPNPLEELEADLLLHELAAVSSTEQYELAAMRLQGYSVAEAALSHGMSTRRAYRLLKEMYQTYLRLYILN